MKLIAVEIDWKHEAMKRKNRKPHVFPPPDDGREWILLDDAAKLIGMSYRALLYHARKQNWTRTFHKSVKTWLLKKDFDFYLWFIKEREYWYKKRRPKTWKPMVSMEPKEAEVDFPRYWWTTAQAAEFMGVHKCIILQWVKKGKIPMFTTRKMGRGGKYWYSPTSLRNLKASEEWQKGHAVWEKIKATMRQGTVAREVYTQKHKPYIYQGIPPGWITLREVAERLDISIATAQRLRRMNRFQSKQFVGEWDAKRRPWFCDEDGVERLKNDEEYQRARQRERIARQARLAQPSLDAAPSTEETYPKGDHMMPDKLTFGYTREELQLGASLTIEW